VRPEQHVRAHIGAILLAAIALGAAIAPARAANCEVFGRPVALGGDAAVEMIARSGKDCRVRFYRDEVFDVETLELSARPLHGGARVQAPYSAYYRSNPGYRGRDHFIFTLCGSQGRKTGCSSVFVKVIIH
jgi:hypothetical protein